MENKPKKLTLNQQTVCNLTKEEQPNAVGGGNAFTQTCFHFFTRCFC